jgi:hypothetical protein
MPGFSGNVLVETPAGLVSFAELRELARGSIFIKNETGEHRAELLVEAYRGPMIDMGLAHLVKPDQVMRSAPPDTWAPARVHFSDRAEVDFAGEIFDLHVLSFQPRDHHFILGNGEVAHNKSGG